MKKNKPVFPVKDFFLKGGSLKKEDYVRIVQQHFKDHPEDKLCPHQIPFNYECDICDKEE